MMKRILWTALILASATPAFAAPIWQFNQTNLGNGLIAVDVNLNLNDDLGGPAALIVTFSGAIKQVDALDPDLNPAQIDQSSGGAGVGATKTDTSALFDYDKSLDSWFYFGTATGANASTSAKAWRTPIAPFNGITGGEVGSTSFSMSAGSGNGPAGQVSGQEFIPVAHLLIDLNTSATPTAGGAGNPNRTLNYMWQTGHASTDGTQSLQFPAGGGFANDSIRLIPEPSSFVLAGFGLVALAGLVRRRRAA